MNTPIKSDNELLMEQYEKEGKVKTFTAEESLAIISELNKGMEDIIYKLKLNEKASAQELKKIVLNV
jgi:hypothetical protein